MSLPTNPEFTGRPLQAKIDSSRLTPLIQKLKTCALTPVYAFRSLGTDAQTTSSGNRWPTHASGACQRSASPVFYTLSYETHPPYNNPYEHRSENYAETIVRNWRSL